jgi:hypothetical protein
MESEEKNGISSQEEGKSCAKLLEKLGEQLNSSNASIRRQAAFNLSWMQEDGLEVLKGALFSSGATRTKNAAAYGLRKMRGRMKKMAFDVLRQGLEQRDSATREVCKHALRLVGEDIGESPATRKTARPRIKEISGNRRPPGRSALQRANPRGR